MATPSHLFFAVPSTSSCKRTAKHFVILIFVYGSWRHEGQRLNPETWAAREAFTHCGRVQTHCMIDIYWLVLVLG